MGALLGTFMCESRMIFFSRKLQIMLLLKSAWSSSGCVYFTAGELCLRFRNLGCLNHGGTRKLHWGMRNNWGRQEAVKARLQIYLNVPLDKSTSPNSNLSHFPSYCQLWQTNEANWYCSENIHHGTIKYEELKMLQVSARPKHLFYK